jgi:hypothetical protein
VELDEISKEEEMGEEDQEDVINMMEKVTWIETVLI